MQIADAYYCSWQTILVKCSFAFFFLYFDDFPPHPFIFNVVTWMKTKNKLVIIHSASKTMFSIQGKQLHHWIEQVLSYKKNTLSQQQCWSLENVCIDPLSFAQNTHCLTVLTSTVWSSHMFSRTCWMSLGAIFFSLLKFH